MRRILYEREYTSQRLSNILVHASLWHIYHMTKVVETVVVTCCDWYYALLHCMCDLKTAQINISLIFENLFFTSSNSYNPVKVTKNICGANSEGSVDHNAIIKWFNKFLLGCKNLNNQARLDRHKICTLSNIGRVSDGHSLLESSVVPRVTKILCCIAD